MSVSSEFQRYLATLVRRLRETGAERHPALLGELEALAEAADRQAGDLSAAARRALAALETAPAPNAATQQGGQENLQAACDDLVSICHVILGR